MRGSKSHRTYGSARSLSAPTTSSPPRGRWHSPCWLPPTCFYFSGQIYPGRLASAPPSWLSTAPSSLRNGIPIGTKPQFRNDHVMPSCIRIDPMGPILHARVTRFTVILSLAIVPLAAQTYRAPRTADGKPDLNGIWQALNEANYD